MLFNSYIYLLLFLPISVLGYLQFRQRSPVAGLVWLNICSFFFYGWWNPAYLPLLLASIFANFQLGKQLSKQSDTQKKKSLLVLGITLNLCLLGYFKYTDFTLANLNLLLDTHFIEAGIVLPLAISFFTFNQIAFLVDAHDGAAEEYQFNHYCFFVSFFPHLLAGPIVHHHELISQISASGNKARIPWAAALTIISFGLFKKVVLADFLGYYADQVFSGEHTDVVHMSAMDNWIGALAFTLQIYFDFSAYCDIAYGSALLFGIQLPQNFLSPYKTTGIIDFWKRWHMTLGRFITSYIYTPLLRSRLGALSFTKAMWMTLLSMTLVGLWHGAGWNYIAFGFVHGLMLVCNHLWRKLPLSEKAEQLPFYQGVCVLFTFTLVMLSLILFRAHDLSSALTMYQSMFNWHDLYWTHQLQQPTINGLCDQLDWALSPMQKILPLLLLMLAWIWFLPNLQQIMADQPYAINTIPLTKTRFVWQQNTLWAMLTAIALIAGLMAVHETGTFIYFQF